MSKGIGGHHRAFRGRSDDWITPKFILDALGEFDLDPCACDPQPWLAAKTQYTINEDGLSQPWFGRVWMNPPYGPETSKWLKKLANHNCGVALIFARTETEMFFESVWTKASAVFFIQGRLYFYHPDGTRATHNSGAPSVLVSYGCECGQLLKNSGLNGRLVWLDNC